MNGNLSAATLTGISTPGVLRTDAAGAFERLRTAAAVVGLNMGSSHPDHAYRSLDRQEAVFRARYTTDYAASARHDHRTWRGLSWWRRPGAGPAATPGTSNHGLGVALDFQGLGGRGYAWMQGNAGRFGWWQPAIYRQGGAYPEPWHWEYVPTLDVDAVTTPVVRVPTPPTMTVPDPIDLRSVLEMITPEQLDGMIRRAVGAELSTLRHDASATKTKIERLEPQLVLFETKDGANGWWNRLNRTWAVTKDSRLWKGFTDVLLIEEIAGTLSVGRWADFPRTTSNVVEDPARLGTQVPWASTLPR